jgi:Flp pilus assembly pilin Flp
MKKNIFAEEGAAAVEYASIAALIAGVIIAGVAILGRDVLGLFLRLEGKF